MEEFTKLKDEYISKVIQELPDDLKDLKLELSEFQKYQSIRLFNINWADENNEFMEKIGLPKSAPSMIEFREPNDLNENFIDIGFNNYGDRIVIVKYSGVISYINHDFDDRLEYINKDAVSLFKSIYLFQTLTKEVKDFAERIEEIDPKAFDKGNWWHQEYINLIELEE